MSDNNRPYSNYVSRVFPGFIEFFLWFSIIVIPIVVGILFGTHWLVEKEVVTGMGLAGKPLYKTAEVFSWGYFLLGYVLGFIGTFILNILTYGSMTLIIDIKTSLANLEKGIPSSTNTKDEITATKTKYDFVGNYDNNGLAPVRLNGKYGFINEKEKEIIPTIYDYALPFQEELAAVKLDNKWGYVNKSGKVAIPIELDDANSFINGIAKVKYKGELEIINRNGEIIKTT